MNKFNKEDRFWAIVWIIFAIMFAIIMGFGLSSVSSASVANKEVSKTDQVICLKRLSATELQFPLISIKREICHEQNLVAEPLHGPDLYRFYISQIHEQYYPDVDPYIALAVLEIESNYVPNLKSPAGAVGLMQWIPKWHAWRMEKFNLNDMWDPYTNIVVGMDYLNDLYFSTESWGEALYGYNHSAAYVNAVFAKAGLLREGGYFG